MDADRLRRLSRELAELAGTVGLEADCVERDIAELRAEQAELREGLAALSNRIGNLHELVCIRAASSS